MSPSISSFRGNAARDDGCDGEAHVTITRHQVARGQHDGQHSRDGALEGASTSSSNGDGDCRVVANEMMTGVTMRFSRSLVSNIHASACTKLTRVLACSCLVTHTWSCYRCAGCLGKESALPPRRAKQIESAIRRARCTLANMPRGLEDFDQ